MLARPRVGVQVVRVPILGFFCTALLCASSACDRGPVRQVAPPAPTPQVAAGDVVESDAPTAAADEPVPAPEPAADEPAPEPAADGAPAELRDAMSRFQSSLREQDVDAFLGLFSQRRPFRELDTLEPGAGPRTVVAFEKLERDLRAKRGKYEVLFDAGGDDCLRDYVVDHYQRPWTWLPGNKFVPHDTGEDSVWVRWDREGERWVVVEIAMPSA